jgi:FkbM family methyltransferase
MQSPFRNVKLHWRRLLNVQEVTLDGIRVSTAADTVPRFVRSALLKGTYEGPERELTSRLLQPGDRVLEIGTGIGLVSSLCARICGPGNVLSYEANPLLERVIRGNYALNGLTPNLRMRAITVDGQPVTFYRSDNIVSSSTMDRGNDAERITVESDRFEDVIAEHRPDAVIMDVEGAETDLLTHSRLAGIKHIVVEIHPHITGEKPVSDMLSYLEGHGFERKSQQHKTWLLSRP